MADTEVLPPVAPDRASFVGRLLNGYVWNAGVAGTVGAAVGGLFGSLPGAAIGMTIGVVGAMIFTGRKYGSKDAAKWQEYEAQRQEFMEATGEDWPNARQSWGRKIKMVAGTGVATGLLAFGGLLPAATAVAAFAFYGSMLGGAYLLTRLVHRNRQGDDGPQPEGYGSDRNQRPPMFGETPWKGGRSADNPWGQAKGPLSGRGPWTGGPFGTAYPSHAAAA